VSERTIVCVLGMHRSGTSLVARLLNLLGADLGPEEHMIQATSANPAGYWESRGIKEINEEILSRLGGSWLEPPDFPDGWERSPALADLRQQARELIETDFSSSDVLGFKDPRNCLTLAFWQRILGPMRYVICLRNPSDVAASLEMRKGDDAPFELGVELWLTYVLSALAVTAGQPREFMFYEDLMANPGAGVRRLGDFIGQDGSAAVDSAIEVAMLEGLWHHRTTVSNVVDSPQLAFHVKAFYLALRQFLSGGEPVGVDTLELFGTYAAETGRHLADLESALEHACQQVQHVEERLSSQSRELTRVEESYAEERRLRRRLEADLRAFEADGIELSPGKPQGHVARAKYNRLVADVRERTAELIPSGATVLVASKGDDELLQLNGSRGWHFPSAPDGSYAGYHPAGDTAAIAHLEALRTSGADHLVLPATALWWLDHYQGLRRHLEERYLPLLEDDRCVIYRLTGHERESGSGPVGTLKRAVASLRVRGGRDPSILDWASGLEIAQQLPESPVFGPPEDADVLPYLDRSVDIVALASTNPARLA
jgi:hypothetical protein